MGDIRTWLATFAIMPIDLEREDVPKHVQLADWIRARIDDGTYAPRSRIPSEATYVQETGFARDTVRKAIAVLVDEGRLYIVRGLGTFVAPEREDPRTPLSAGGLGVS
jgi:GntR family transcriptional regulator